LERFRASSAQDLLSRRFGSLSGVRNEILERHFAAATAVERGGYPRSASYDHHDKGNVKIL
jgi:hypothetical protein